MNRRIKYSAVIFAVSKERKIWNLYANNNNICLRCFYSAHRRSVEFHTNNLSNIGTKNKCNTTRIEWNKDSFPYKIAVNIQCSLTFSCMCCVVEQQNLVYLLFHAHSLSHHTAGKHTTKTKRDGTKSTSKTEEQNNEGKKNGRRFRQWHLHFTTKL